MSRLQSDRRGLRWVAVGHAVTDVNQSAVPALLPFLVAERGLSYTAASGLVLASTLLSAVVQPSLGHLSDRRRLPWLAPLGVLTAGLGLAAAGLCAGYAAVVAALVLSGLGVAAFHPEASRSALDLSPGEKARGMSAFTVGGNVGTALGPVVATTLAGALGVRGIALLTLPSAFLAWRLHRLPQGRRAAKPARIAPPMPAAPPLLLETDPPPPASIAALSTRPRLQTWAFVRLIGVIVLRSIFSFGLMTFVPLYLTRVRGLSPNLAGGIVTAMLLVGIVGSLAAGRLADRFGRRRTMLGALAPLPFLVLAFAWTDGPLGLALLGVATAGSLATYTVAVVLGQEYLPGREGIAMGVTIGLAASIGGGGLPLLGLVADRWGLGAVIDVLAAVPALAFLIALSLPREPRTARSAPPQPSRPAVPPSEAPRPQRSGGLPAHA